MTDKIKQAEFKWMRFVDADKTLVRHAFEKLMRQKTTFPPNTIVNLTTGDIDVCSVMNKPPRELTADDLKDHPPKDYEVPTIIAWSIILVAIIAGGIMGSWMWGWI